MLNDTVQNQLTEGTSSLYLTNAPYVITEEDELLFKSIEINLLKWDISGIEIPIEIDSFMSTSQELPIVTRANLSGTLNIEVALDEYLDNYYALWKWGQMYMKSANRKAGGSPYGKQILRKAFCDYAEIPILNNNLNDAVYIQLEKVRLKSISGFSFGNYSSKSVTSKASFVFNDIALERVSKKIAT
jgi:hypothetical protein